MGTFLDAVNAAVAARKAEAAAMAERQMYLNKRAADAFKPFLDALDEVAGLAVTGHRWHDHTLHRLDESLYEKSATRIGFYDGAGNRGFFVTAECGDDEVVHYYAGSGRERIADSYEDAYKAFARYIADRIGNWQTQGG